MEATTCSFCDLPESTTRRLWRGPPGAAICAECSTRIRVAARCIDVPLPAGAPASRKVHPRDRWNLANPERPIDETVVQGLLPHIDWLISAGYLEEARFTIESQLRFFPAHPDLLDRLQRAGGE